MTESHQPKPASASASSSLDRPPTTAGRPADHRDRPQPPGRSSADVPGDVSADASAGDQPQPERGRQAAWAAWAFIAVIVVVTMLGAALRLHQLDRPSFWADELYSIRSIVEPGVPPLWRVLAHSATWAGLAAGGADLAAAAPDAPEHWRALGIDAWQARIGPAVIGTLSIPLLAWAGRRVLGTRGAVLLAVLLAVLPWHVEWSQNARFYIGLYLFYGLSVLLYFDATTRRSRLRMGAAMLCFVLAFMHHPPGIFLAGVFVADWLLSRAIGRPPRLGAFGYVSVAAGVGVCLLLLYIDMQTMSAGYARLETQGRGHSLAMLLAGTAWYVHPIIIAIAAATAWQMIARRERLGLYLLLVALVPLAVLGWLSATDHMFVHVRYGFMASVGYVALAALGLDRLYAAAAPHLGRVLAAAPAATVLIALLLVDLSYHSGGHGFRSRWGEAFAYVRQQRRPGETVATNFTLAGRYYLETANVVSFPTSAEQLADMPGRVWLVTAVESAQGVEDEQWIDAVANLQTYFDTHVEQPYSSIRVYRHEADRAQPPIASAIPTARPPRPPTGSPVEPSRTAGRSGD